MSKNTNSVKMSVHNVSKDNISAIITDHSTFITINLQIANHSIVLFVDETEQIGEIVRVLSNPTYNTAP